QDTLTNSFSTVALTANLNQAVSSFANVGGIAGTNGSGLIDQSYFNGSIIVNQSAGLTSNVVVGGLSGTNIGFSGVANTTDSYNNGTITYNISGGVSSLADIGGLTGSLDGGSGAAINSSLSTGLITVTGGTAGGVGGIAGLNNVLTPQGNSFWDINATGQSVGVGLGTSSANFVGGCFGNVCSPQPDLSQSSTYSNAGWNIGGPGSGATWQIVNGAIYPHLISEGLHTISGTVYADNGVTPVG